MLACLRNTRLFASHKATRAMSSTTDELVSIVSAAMPANSGADAGSSDAAAKYSGPQVSLKPWSKRHSPIKNRSPYSPFYSPNDFQRSRRVIDRTGSGRTQPSGLGPSAARSKLSDPFHIMGVNPANEYANSKLMSSFLTSMGMIKNRGATGLTRRNQRMLAKGVKRARNMGVIPIFSRSWLE